MKKLLVVIGFGLLALTATPVFAADVSEPNVVQGSVTENYRGTKVTASYAACGSIFDVGYDPLAKYIATISKGNRVTTTVWAHSIGRLSEVLGSFGYSLSQDQVDMFVELRAEYVCVL
jgi:hypothetical protein